MASNILKILQKNGSIRFSNKFSVKDEFGVLRDLRRSAAVFSVGIEQLENTVKKFSSDLERNSEKLSKKGKAEIKKEAFSNMSSAISFLFESWKSQKKAMEEIGEKFAGEKSVELADKARGNMIVEVVGADRKELIKTASNLIAQNPKLTVVLVNNDGDVIGMSKNRDMCSFIRDVCEKCGGKGGGGKELGQGKICSLDSFDKMRRLLCK
jgi:alanyl-tRNA synthetase